MPDENASVIRVSTASRTRSESFSIEVAQVGEVRVSSGQTYSFEDFSASLEALTSNLRDAIAKVAPKKAVIEFGVEVGVESGKLTALLVKGSGRANLRVTLEWS